MEPGQPFGSVLVLGVYAVAHLRPDIAHAPCRCTRREEVSHIRYDERTFGMVWRLLRLGDENTLSYRVYVAPTKPKSIEA
jgi:hypothetical protein